MHRRQILALAAAAVVAPPIAARAAPSAELWGRWSAYTAGSSLRVDHGRWDRITQQYVSLGSDGVARVDYGALKQNRAGLDTYLASLEPVDVAGLDRPEQMAFWINLYNALTVRVIVDHYPVASIRDIDISPGFFANGPWGAKLVEIDGTQMSLDDIEHRVLRPIWKDPRIHYAVNCASIGCPNLAPRAYTASRLEEMMDAGARAYVNDPRGAFVKGGRITASKIYDWFQEDFGNSEAGVIRHLAKYAKRDLAAQLAGKTSISDFEYDWALNTTATGAG